MSVTPVKPPNTPSKNATTSLIDPQHDPLIPIRQLAKERLGKSISPSCQWRWIRRGVRGVRLEAVQAMGVWCTTPAAFGAFISGQTRAALGDSPPPGGPAVRSQEKVVRLRKAGLLK